MTPIIMNNKNRTEQNFQLLKALELDTQIAHSTQNGTQNQTSVKTEKPKLPSITVNMSESDKIFFKQINHENMKSFCGRLTGIAQNCKQAGAEQGRAQPGQSLFGSYKY